MIQDSDSKGTFITEPLAYERREERLFSTDRSWCSDNMRNSFVVVSTGGKEGSELWAAKLQLFSRLGVGGSMEGMNLRSRFLEVMQPIDTVGKTIECVSLKWSTDDEVDYGLRRDTAASQKDGYSRRQWFET